MKDNKGIALFLVLGLASVALILSIAFVGKGIQERFLSRRYSDSLVALYAADKGIEYAFIETQNHNWSWSTHKVDTLDVDNDQDTTELIPRFAPPNPAPETLPTGFVTLTGGSYDFGTGCYRVSTSSGLIEVKTYTDPNKPDETIALCRSTSGSSPRISRILKYRITRRSLYQYLYFYPSDKTFSSMTIDGGVDDSGNKLGRIYVNGSIWMHNSTFTNMTELSTKTTGSILKYNFPYSAPYKLDAVIGGARDGGAPLPSLTGSHIYSASNPYPWQSGNWPPSSWPPLDWWNVNRHFYYDPATSYTYQAATVNGTNLPVTLSHSWDWTKYNYANPGDEVAVQFYDVNGNPATQAYWNNLAASVTGGASYFDTAFWSNKTYERTSNTVPVNFLNTGNQWTDWQNWLNGGGSALKGVVKTGSDGYNAALASISSTYSTAARTNGLYIYYYSWGGWNYYYVYFNGQYSYGYSLPGSLTSWITDNVQFFNTVRPKDRSYPTDGVVDKETVLQLDIGASVRPNNGIIYIDGYNGTGYKAKNVRLVNAARLPSGGLTVVTPYNIYIKGNYNTDSAWQPAAVISNSLVYTLSNEFNDPQTLPATIYPREYPYELKYLSKLTACYDNNGNLKSDYIPGDLQLLEDESKSFFGLSSFDIRTTPPANTSALTTAIRQKYNQEYISSMPNKVTANTTMNVAIVSQYEPQGYQLERWRKESWSSDSSTWSPTLTITGAFLKVPSWSTYSDVPSTYLNKRTGGANLVGLDPITMQSAYTTYTINPTLRYEKAFATTTPPGDFFAGSQSSWEEVFDFDHHI